MSILIKKTYSNSSVNDQQNLTTEIMAHFLNQTKEAITCKPLTGGSIENSIFKCTHSTNSYVVKFFSAADTGKNEIAWTQHASNLGIGPKLYYYHPDGNYMIMGFAKGNSLVPITANKPGVIKNIAESLAQLHQSAAPFAHSSDIFTRIEEKYKKLLCSGKLKESLVKNYLYIKKIEDQLHNFAIASVPCHNDLNPGNIFADNNETTLIDWGDASLANPYYDIAAFFVLNVIDPEHEKLFWMHYSEKSLNQELQIYMNLYKQVVYFEFALNLLLGVQASNRELLNSNNIPEVQKINYYLTQLATREEKIDSNFLYHMALASLNELDSNRNNI